MNLSPIFKLIKTAWHILLQILHWIVVIAFLYSLFFTQEKVFAAFMCQMLVVWFFVEYVRVIRASNHARKKYDIRDPELWKLENKLEQRFKEVLGWAFLGGLGATIIAIWKVLRQCPRYVKLFVKMKLIIN